MFRKMSFALCAMFALTALSGCDTLKDALEEAGLDDLIGTCLEPCAKIQECGSAVSPPAPQAFGDVDAPDLGGGVDCAANCADAGKRALYGYSDCQLECISGEGCGAINDCWKASSDVYASYCLADREIEEVAPDGAGSDEADEFVEDPAVAAAVEGSGFVVKTGANPPLFDGQFSAIGSIDESAGGAREPGSTINTELCFFDALQSDAGAEVSYCELSIAAGSSRAPITGDAETGDFTVYFDFSDYGATILFSGNTPDGGVTFNGVEALVVYLQGVDIWERSTTDWTNSGDDTCQLECGG